MRVLMTGGGAPGAAGIIRCLQSDKDLYLVTCDARQDAVGRFLNPHFEQIPPASSPNFLHEVIEVCKKHSINIILPLVTRELPVFANNLHLLAEEGIKVIVSPAESLDIAVDKGRLYQHLQSNNIETPDFYIANTYNAFTEAVEKLGYPERPVCFKPCMSNGSRGFRIISDQVDEFDLLFNYKPDTTYITYEKIKTLLLNRAFPQLLVSEVLPGEEYSVDCLVDEGKAQLIIPRRRIKMIGGISVEGEFIADPQIVSYCHKILSSMQLHGNIGIQVKGDSEGNYQILEINPRVQGTIVSALGMGVNLPLWAVYQEMGRKVNITLKEADWGVKFIRYWQEVYYK